MPLLAIKSYRPHDDERPLVDESDQYNLQNYHIRDDSEITSSDEDKLDDGCGESDERSYYSSSRPQTANIEATPLDGNDDRSKRPKSGSPFKRGIGSLFKRHEPYENAQNDDSASEIAESEVQQLSETTGAAEAAEEPTANATNSTKFWRSWRLRHRRHGGEQFKGSDDTTAATQEEEEYTFDGQRDSNAGKLADVGADNIITEEAIDSLENSPQRKLDARHLQESPDTMARVVRLKERLRVHSFDSDISDEVIDDLGLSQSHSKLSGTLSQLASPLTPVEETITWKKDTTTTGVQQYQHIYRTPQDYVALEDQFDNLQVNKNSKTYINLLNIIGLLDGSSQDVVKRRSLQEFSDAILRLVNEVLEERELTDAEGATTAHNSANATSKDYSHESSRALELETELSLLREKYEDSVEGFYACRKELNLVEAKLREARNEVDESEREVFEIKTDFEAQKTEWRKTATALETQLKEATESQKCEQVKQKTLKDDYNNVQSQHSALKEENIMLQEQSNASRNKIHELIGMVSTHENEMRKLQQSNERLQKEFSILNQLATKAKTANIKLKSDCQRERCKVLDCRRDLDLLRGQLEIAMCHKMESLQFMAQLMISFRDALCERTLQKCDSYLESMNSNKLFSCVLAQSNTVVTEQQLMEQACQERNKIAEFYRHFAKKNLLDQVFAKYVSYMRSNRFLSQQLKGLRQQSQDHEEYISRLLKDCKAQRVLIAKQDHRIAILNKNSTPQTAAPAVE
ncbi:LANO_0A05600g1_1 [Lachancea nothofagi CBS 11611]|uniref:LANO_0A05600g1_1 n=1 Tax=Lachancea nothofagi CBS 11611 TaxID=1266666 RepID=A0A1G4IR18_9SACH|nr:LANO_0A05600g1_1 [Lachancea nothofagi CBS 11611]